MPPRLFAIGDIHGCLTALDTLLDSLELTPKDRLVFLGDYIDRGPNSRGVLERMIELGSSGNHIFLRGNHEAWMLSARINFSMFQSWWEVGGLETMDSYNTRDLIFVHGASGTGPLEETGEHWLLWQRINNIEPHPSGKRTICGHTKQRNGCPLDREFAVCIDTGAHAGSWLTALEVNSDEVFQADELGRTRSGTLEELGVRAD